MADADRPKGQLFSHVYLERGQPKSDDRRLRNRVFALGQTIELRSSLADSIHLNLGVKVPMGYERYNWERFFAECEIQDLLSTITLAHRLLISRREHIRAQGWAQGIARIFAEQNVHYEIDEQGGVHHAVDPEFAANRSAKIASLQGARYRNALDRYKKGLAKLRAEPPDGKGAITDLFASAECLFKLMCPRAARLGSAEADAISPLLEQQLKSDPVATRSAKLVLKSFKGWIDAAHFYRHEAGSEEVTQPPFSLAVQLISLGASYIRWLADIDGETSRRVG
jgi:hypothetical protein